MENKIELTILDKKNFLNEDEFKSKLSEMAPLLEAAKKGEKEYKNFLGWLSVDETAGEEHLKSLCLQADQVRKDADVFVVIGIGGSNQASRAAIHALRPQNGPEIIWTGNTISAMEMKRTLEELERYRSIYINCIAKNFETLEPGIAFRMLRRYLEKRYGIKEASRRIFATGTPGSTLEQLCIDNGYTFLVFPEKVGGRYSAGTDVGLFPMAVAGIDICAVVSGMRNMKNRLLRESAKDNIALKYAVARKLLYDRGYNIEMMAYFEPRLDYFAKWWIQAFAESEGKDSKALYPVAVSASEDLHSVGQFIQQGNPILFETFLQVREKDASVILPYDEKKDYFDYLAGKDFWDINNIARCATMKAHSERGIPCLNFSIPAIDEHTLGELFYLFMFSCYLSCRINEVNPFDQPGVEFYKKNMFKELKKLVA